MSRTAEIAKILSKYGLNWLSQSSSPWSVLAAPRGWFGHKPVKSQPKQVLLALEELGTTYIKLGQAISTRTDLVPPEYIAELEKLQDDAPPVPYAEIAKVVCEELGAAPEEVFGSFDPEPLAAASIGQVHRATLKDGRPVVVKVQRPGAFEQVKQDLEVLQEIAKLLSASPKLANYDFEGLYEEFAFTIRNELDYRREGRNADRFRLNFAADPMLKVPIVFWETTTRRVITMEAIEGIKVTDTEALDAQGFDRRKLAQEAARIVITEVFQHGLFHADPHAGNFFVLPGGVLGLIDYGMVGRLDREERESLMRMTLALSYQDAESLIDEVLTVGFERRPVSRQQLKIDISRLLQIHMEAPPEEFSMARMFQDTLAMASQHGIQIPSDLLFLARTLAMCEGLGKTLDANYRMEDSTRTQLERIYRERYSPDALKDRARENYIEIGEFALDLPRRTRRLFGQLERGELTFNARFADMKEFTGEIHRAVNRLAMSFILAGIIGGLSVLSLKLRTGPWMMWANALLVVVVVGGLMLLLSMWRSRKGVD